MDYALKITNLETGEVTYQQEIGMPTEEERIRFNKTFRRKLKDYHIATSCRHGMGSSFPFAKCSLGLKTCDGCSSFSESAIYTQDWT